MPIPVECPGCGKRYKVRDDQAGDTIACKDCGDDIDVPSGRRGGGGGGSRGRRKAKSGGDNTGLIIGGAAGGMVLLGLIAFFAFSGRGGPLPPPPGPPTNQTTPIASNPAPTQPPANTNPAPKFGPGQNQDPNRRPSNPVAPGAAGMAGGSDLNLGNKNDKNKSTGFGPKEQNPETKQILNASTSDWTAQPDPLADPPKLEGNKKIAFKFPGDWPEKTSVLYPATPSTVVSVGDNRNAKGGREIWDMATNAKIGTIKGVFNSEVMAISPDGLYVAAAFQSSVDVWDVKGKKTLGRFDLGSGRGFRGVTYLAFTRPDRLLGIGSEGDGKLLKIPSGEIEREISLGNRVDASKGGVSPNGRYFAYKKADSFGELTIALLDLDTDNVAGEIQLKADKHGTRLELGNIAFSPKGDEVAVLVEEGWSKDCILYIVNMKDGSEADLFTIDGKTIEALNIDRWSKYTTIAWFPGAHRLLLKGHGIIDRSVKSVIFKLPPSEVEIPDSRRMLTDTLALAVDGNRNNAVLIGLPLKEEDLAKTVESVAKGGLPGDAQLPPLTKPDWSSIEDVTFADRDGQWTVTPDPAPEPAERLLMRGMPLRQGKGDVRQVIVSRADSARMFARVTDGEIPQGRWKEPLPKETWIDAYDLAARKPTNKFKVPLPCEMVSASPDGTRVLIRTTAALGRIDVYTDDGTHVCGWRPYQDEPDDNHREVVAAAFVDATHLATVNSTNKLVMWELPTCKAIYGIENAALPALTQGTKYLTFADLNTYDFRDALTGKSCGEIKIEDGQGISSVAFHPNGEKLAILLDDDGSLFLITVDMKTGEQSERIPVPPDFGPAQAEAQNAYMTALQRMRDLNARLARVWKNGNRALAATMPMHWTDDDHVLLNNYRLFDVKQKVIVWQYVLPVGAHLPTSSDGRHWYVTTKSAKGGGPPFLVAQSMPDKLALKEIGDKPLEPKYITYPGVTIGWQMKLLTPPNKQNFQEEVMQAILRNLGKRKVTVADNQPLKLTLNMEQRTGESLQYRSRNTGQVSTVQQQFIMCEAYVESGGVKHWEVSTESSNAMWSVQYRTGTLEQALAEGMWATPSTYFQNLIFPAYIFDKKSAQGLGISTLTVDGTEKANMSLK